MSDAVSSTPPSKKKKGFLRVLLFGAGGLILLVVIGLIVGPPPPNADKSDSWKRFLASQTPTKQSKQSPATAPETTSAISQARQWTAKVKATVDQTTLDQLMPQMPDDIVPKASRNGESRLFTWVFDDGSQLELTFRPKGGEGTGAGLVLYMAEVK